MKLGLQLKLKQTLAPQLIQSLKMLQMPLLKLEQTLRHELAINPLLEDVEEIEVDQREQEPEFDVAADGQETDPVEPPLGKVDWEDYFSNDDDYGYRIREVKEVREDSFLSVVSTEKTLYDHLHEQLSFLRLSEEEHQIGEYILGNIDSSGYLVVSAAEMAKELDIPVEKIDEILELIKKFDPSGVGARNLRESLLIQLRDRGLTNSLAYRIVEDHLYDLEKKTIMQIAKAMGVQLEKVQAAMDVIKRLSPTPAHGRFESGAAAIIPDLIVDRVGHHYVVFHNERSLPNQRLNP